MNYVYIKSEPELFTVGFYKPDGKFEPESDHKSEADARDRVTELNGGGAMQLNMANPRFIQVGQQLINLGHVTTIDLRRSTDGRITIELTNGRQISVRVDETQVLRLPDALDVIELAEGGGE
jgi:hypothetical protein